MLVALSSAGLLVDGAGADSTSTRAERDRIRAERAAAAAQLEPLLAEDEELEAAVAELVGYTESQQERVDAIRREIGQTDATIADVEARIVAGEAERDRLGEVARSAAVDAYVDGARDDDAWLRTSDLSAASRQQFLTDAVVRNVDDLIDAVRGVEARLDADRTELGAARAAAEALRVEEQARLDELSAALEEQRRLEAALQVRIDDFQAEVDALAAEESRLGVLLERQVADEEAARRAAEEAARRAAERANGGGGGRTSGGGAPAAGVSMRWPANGVVTSRFGPRWGRVHRGIDIGAATGSSVVAAAGGSVIQAGTNGAFGTSVIVDHGGGVATLYAHLSALSVESGDTVGSGDQLGAVGCTGSCTGPHLHFEVRIGGVAYDPMLYLP